MEREDDLAGQDLTVAIPQLGDDECDCPACRGEADEYDAADFVISADLTINEVM